MEGASGGGLEEQLARALRKVERERAARREAESLLEQKSLELYHSNQRLRQQAAELEAAVVERTQELQEALRRAEAAARAKDNFLATVSHEVRTPLNGIIGLGDVLALSPLDAEQTQHLDLMMQSAHSLLALINDILDFSKIEAGRLDLEMRSFSPLAELRGIVETFRIQAAAKSLALVDRLDGLPASVVGDSLRLRQILSNLLSNAIKFTHSGQVVVEASAERVAEHWRITLEVTDTGIGFSPESSSRIFDPFSQEDSSISRKFGGTGLGLAICRQLARAMGGDIEAESSEVTVFRVTVTLADGGALPVRPGASTGQRVPLMAVLVVDDNAINRSVAVALLAKLGQKAIAVSSGPEAIERASAQRFDLILMDMQMPGMDGLAATREIRKLPLAHQPRIVALTANAYASDRERCIEAGMDGFLAKPYRLEQVRAELCSLCSRGPECAGGGTGTPCG